MDDSPMCSISEECLLPSEDFETLFKLLNYPGLVEQSEIQDASGFDVAGLEPVPTTSRFVRSSLPAVENWKGLCDFRVCVKSHQDGTNWSFSETTNKIYVRKDVPCPFTFETNPLLPHSAVVRAFAVFTLPNHASEVVHGCVNHSRQDIIDGKPEAEYFIKSDNSAAIYEVDHETKALSVVLPLVNCPGSSVSVTHVYKFLCFNSCSGGPNRKPLTLVFNLEAGNSVIGRCSLELKVCSSPKRDRRMDESTVSSKVASSVTKVKILEDSNKVNVFNPPEEEYVIRVKDIRCYDFLKKMEKVFAAKNVLKFKQLISSSSDEATDSCIEF